MIMKHTKVKDIKQHLCDEIHKFVNEHIDEVENKINFWGRKQTYDELGFKNRSDMLKQIKENHEIAFWALTELLDWGMSKEHSEKSTKYCKELYVYEEDEDGNIVYKIGDRFFVASHRYKEPFIIKEVKKVTKLIEVNTWEDMI